MVVVVVVMMIMMMHDAEEEKDEHRFRKTRPSQIPDAAGIWDGREFADFEIASELRWLDRLRLLGWLRWLSWLRWLGWLRWLRWLGRLAGFATLFYTKRLIAILG